MFEDLATPQGEHQEEQDPASTDEDEQPDADQELNAVPCHDQDEGQEDDELNNQE